MFLQKKEHFQSIFDIQAGHVSESIEACSEFLKYSDPEDLDVLCDRAEAYLLIEDYDSGKYFLFTW